MGQQQLLLVILVTIIVGIATVVAINTFSEAADSANVDAVRQDMISMASAAQGYYMKPTMMEGGGNSFANIEITDLNCPGDVDGEGQSSAGNCVNENGTYTISNSSAGQFTLTGDPANGTNYTVDTPGSADNTLTLTVFPDDASFTN